MSTKSLVLALMANLVLNIGCAQKLFKNDEQNLPTKDTLPRMVFIENQVNPLNTLGDLPDEQRVHVEIRKKDGENKVGNLLNISEEALTISQGSFYETVNDSLIKKERKVVIQKDEVLVLKVW